MKASILATILFILFATATPNCYAQLAAKVAEAAFKKFDANQSGWLSGNELTACNCKQYDTNGDNEVTLEEFFTGKGIKVQATATTTTSGKTSPATNAKAPTANQVAEKTNSTGPANIKGAWWFTAILEGKGKVYQLRNRQSGLDLNQDGRYVLNTWLGGANNMRTTGTYTISGNRLKMQASGGAVQDYNLSFNGDGTMTMEAPNGTGYRAARSNK